MQRLQSRGICGNGDRNEWLAPDVNAGFVAGPAIVKVGCASTVGVEGLASDANAEVVASPAISECVWAEAVAKLANAEVANAEVAIAEVAIAEVAMAEVGIAGAAAVLAEDLDFNCSRCTTRHG
jgi:hypothetical protein